MHSDSDIVISARHLSKTYRLFDHPGDRIKQFFSLGLKRYHKDFTAVHDVSFDIRRGETVGIIGSNGAGKSTLLQLICGILKSTSGSVEVKGRISALLELGAGFNPEFTGCENVFFQGMLMGLNRAQMAARFNEIAAFADIGDFIDQPVRTYSSGMFVRLAFAVMVHVNADILVVDEALAVGDAGFRARCFRRIGELLSTGSTILFVSHSMDEILQHCSRCLLLDAGQLLVSSEPRVAIAQYRRLLNVTSSKRAALREHVRQFPLEPNINTEWDAIEEYGSSSVYQSNGAQITNTRIVDATGRPIRRADGGTQCRCQFNVFFTRNAENVRFAILLKSEDGQDLGGAYSLNPAEQAVTSFAAENTVEVEFSFVCPFNAGMYRINVAAFARVGGIEYALHGIESALLFNIGSESNGCTIGHVDIRCTSSTRII